MGSTQSLTKFNLNHPPLNITLLYDGGYSSSNIFRMIPQYGILVLIGRFSFGPQMLMFHGVFQKFAWIHEFDVVDLLASTFATLI